MYYTKLPSILWELIIFLLFPMYYIIVLGKRFLKRVKTEKSYYKELLIKKKGSIIVFFIHFIISVIFIHHGIRIMEFQDTSLIKGFLFWLIPLFSIITNITWSYDPEFIKMYQENLKSYKVKYRKVSLFIFAFHSLFSILLPLLVVTFCVRSENFALYVLSYFFVAFELMKFSIMVLFIAGECKLIKKPGKGY